MDDGVITGRDAVANHQGLFVSSIEFIPTNDSALHDAKLVQDAEQ